MNSNTLSNREFRLVAIALSLLAFSGCVKDISEPPSTFDLKGNVLALVSPDTVQAGQSFRVQISFSTFCGGIFTHFQQSNTDSAVTITPILHVVAQRECPDTGYVITETMTLNLSTPGMYTLVADGQFGKLSKTIQVVPSVTPHQNFILHYLFVNVQRLPKPQQTAYFLFPDRSPQQLTIIASDSSGIWETTFTDTLPMVRYTIGDITFEAIQGITENGIILYP